MRTLLGLLCGLAVLALTPAPSATSLPSPESLASPSDSTLSPLWLRHLDALRSRIDEAEAEVDPATQGRLATGILRTARALADEPEITANRTLQTLVLRAHTFYESIHGPVAPTPMAPLDFYALRGDALAEAAATAGHPALPDIPASLPPTLPVVSTAPLAAHLLVPVNAAELVEAQTRIAQRFRSLQGRRTLRMIERVLRRRGLPTDLKYVAVIESSLNPTAESHAGAQGLWQFMPETAAEFGLDSLTVLDPARSTEAAARYLRQLGRMFRGDWQLALAAYNAGPGRVRKLVRAHRTETGDYPTFWDIREDLPRETQHYVPRFIAVATLLETPRTRRG
ncbi:MAG: lytic transglycosylase domain-containing protein [Bacteroidota bacterium]